MQKISYFNSIEELSEEFKVYAKSYNNVLFITDTNTKTYCLPKLEVDVQCVEIPAGEFNKSTDSVIKIWEKLLGISAGKNTLLVGLGGGMILDICGFAASTYMRGVHSLFIPTSLLAMVDAAYGGKTGIDFGGVKNLVGTFKFDSEIFVCDEWLKTLPEREYRSGLAEVIKHYLISDSISFYDFDADKINQTSILPLIKKAVSIKSYLIAKDPEDKNVRKALNFGHTIGHAVESVMINTYEPLLHGEAVGIGIICESFISEQRGLISAEELIAIKRTVAALFKLPTIKSIDKVIDYAKHDKKNSDSINCVLLNGIGNFSIDQIITSDDIHAAVHYYNLIVESI